MVLIVDDDDDLRTTMQQVLGLAGIETVGQPSGLAALGWLEGHAELPSLILLDLMMPAMNGWQFRDRQRAVPRIAGIPVVAVTASRNLDESQIDVETILYKPFTMKALCDVVVKFQRAMR